MQSDKAKKKKALTVGSLAACIVVFTGVDLIRFVVWLFSHPHTSSCLSSPTTKAWFTGIFFHSDSDRQFQINCLRQMRSNVIWRFHAPRFLFRIAAGHVQIIPLGALYCHWRCFCCVVLIKAASRHCMLTLTENSEEEKPNEMHNLTAPSSLSLCFVSRF